MLLSTLTPSTIFTIPLKEMTELKRYLDFDKSFFPSSVFFPPQYFSHQILWDIFTLGRGRYILFFQKKEQKVDSFIN